MKVEKIFTISKETKNLKPANDKKLKILTSNLSFDKNLNNYEQISKENSGKPQEMNIGSICPADKDFIKN